jgi:hypothetical protein
LRSPIAYQMKQSWFHFTPSLKIIISLDFKTLHDSWMETHEFFYRRPLHTVCDQLLSNCTPCVISYLVTAHRVWSVT